MLYAANITVMYKLNCSPFLIVLLEYSAFTCEMIILLCLFGMSPKLRHSSAFMPHIPKFSFEGAGMFSSLLFMIVTIYCHGKFMNSCPLYGSGQEKYTKAI